MARCGAIPFRSFIISAEPPRLLPSTSSSSCTSGVANGTNVKLPIYSGLAAARAAASPRFRSFRSYSSPSWSHLQDDDDDQNPPQEAVLKAISEVSKAEGRVAQTTNVVIGGTVTDDATDEWLVLDQKVNSYPTVRGFTAIGTGGDDFVQAMVIAVESILQEPIPEGRITQKLSSRGKYVSVKIGPVQVFSSQQVQAIYNAMRRDNRMKYFL